MNTATMSRPAAPGSKYLFTVVDYHQMVRAGILREDARVELIEGEVLQMAPIGRDHLASTDRLTRRFTALPEKRAQVRIQGSVTLGENNEPQPDVALLRHDPDFYQKRDATSADVLLAIEVSDTTLAFDRNTKIPLYAAAGIRESWIVNLADHGIEVYRKPSRRGYRDKKIHRRGDSVSPLAFPDFSLRVDDVLGPK